MGYNQGYNGYCENCGSYGGCNCNTGCKTSTCSPDYSPVSVNNSICPDVEGSTGTGGNSTATGGTTSSDSSSTASGNSNTIHVNVCGCDCKCTDDRNCCKYGSKKLLNYLIDKSLNDTEKTSNILIYGDTIPNSLGNYNVCTATTPEYIGEPLVSIEDNEDIQVLILTESLLKQVSTFISLCDMSLIRFKFENENSDGANIDIELRKHFKCSKKCNSCECGTDIAQALFYNGLGLLYEITLQDVLFNELVVEDSKNIITQAKLGDITDPNTLFKLVALDCNIAIFSRVFSSETCNQTIYYGVPTCKIAKFRYLIS